MTVTAGFKGARTDRLRTLGTQLQAGADTLAQIRALTGRQVADLAWHGNDRSQFLSTWTTGYAPALDRVATALRLAADSVAAQAAEQDGVSAAGGSSASGGTAGGASGAGTGGGASGGTAGDSTSGGTTGDSTSGGTTGDSTSGGTAGAAPVLGGAAAPASSGSASSNGPDPATQGDRLGELSARHESNGDPSTVSTGKGDHGGISYGKYQIATGTGTAAEYVRWLADTNPEFHDRLTGMTAGSKEFEAAWKAIAAQDPDGFAESQYQFIVQTHFEPAMAETYARVPGFSLEGRSPVVAEMMFSTTVQHRMNTDVIVERALAGLDVASMSDSEIITAIYDERGSDDGGKYFPSSSRNVQHNVAARFEREKAEALAALSN